MKKSLFFLLCSVFFISCSAVKQDLVSVPSCIDEEEYKVYSDFFSDRVNTDTNGKFKNICMKYGAEEVMIQSETDSKVLGTDSLKKLMNIIKDEKLLNDYEKKNENRASWQDNFKLPVRCTLVDFKEFYKELLDSGHKYWQKNPEKDGLYMLRRVGFNDKKDRAIVYVRRFFDYQSAMGQVIIMEKKNDKWSESEGLIVWKE